MKTYIYTVKHSSPLKDCNRTVTVYRIKNNKPVFVGSNAKINIGFYKGDYAAACELISENDGHKMSNCGYSLASQCISVTELR